MVSAVIRILYRGIYIVFGRIGIVFTVIRIVSELIRILFRGIRAKLEVKLRALYYFESTCYRAAAGGRPYKRTPRPTQGDIICA